MIFVLPLSILFFQITQEEMNRGRQVCENLSDPLHILIEAKLPGHIVDKRLRQAQEVIEGWLKPVVWDLLPDIFSP